MVVRKMRRKRVVEQIRIGDKMRHCWKLEAKDETLHWHSRKKVGSWDPGSRSVFGPN